MLKNSSYINNNIIIDDGINTQKLGKPAQVGFDLSVKCIKAFKNKGTVLKTKTYASETEIVPKISFIGPDNKEYTGWYLSKGTYIIELNEGCSFGPNDTGLIYLRSSLNRCGVSIISAVWDPGYTSKDGDIVNTMSIRLTVENDNGFQLEENARVAQLLVFENENTIEYNGQWQGGKKVSNLIEGENK